MSYDPSLEDAAYGGSRTGGASSSWLNEMSDSLAGLTDPFGQVHRQGGARIKTTARKEPAIVASSAPARMRPAKSQPAPMVPAKRPRKFRPGTRALMEIRKYQKSSNLLLPKAVVYRAIREVLDDNDTNLGVNSITGYATEAIQQLVEAQIILIYALAHKIALNGGRITVFERDLRLAIESSQEAILNQLKVRSAADFNASLPSTSKRRGGAARAKKNLRVVPASQRFARLAKRAGIKRVSQKQNFFVYSKALFKEIIMLIVHYAQVHAQYAKVKRVRVKDVSVAARNLGTVLYS